MKRFLAATVAVLLLAVTPQLTWSVDTGVVSFVAAGTLGGALTTTDATAAMPAGLVANDLILISAWTRSTADTTVITGYTEIAQIDTTTGSHRWFYKRAAGGDGTATCDHDQSADNYCQAFAFRGVATSGNPWNALGAPQTTSTADPALTAITTAAPLSMVVAFSNYEDDDNASVSTTSTDPSAYTSNYAETTTGADGAITISYALKYAIGTTGTITVNWDTVFSDAEASLVLSLDPAKIYTLTMVGVGGFSDDVSQAAAQTPEQVAATIVSGQGLTWYGWWADCITFAASVCGHPANGGTFTTWADESGNGNTLTTISAATVTYNTNVINGQGAAAAPGNVGFTTGTAVNCQAKCTMFLVFKVTTAASKQSLISGPINSLTYAVATSGKMSLEKTASAVISTCTTALSNNTWTQVAVDYDQSTTHCWKGSSTDGTISNAVAVTVNDGHAWINGQSLSEWPTGSVALMFVFTGSAVVNGTNNAAMLAALNARYGT